MKVLLIEDEAVLAQDIIGYLTNEQYLCEQAQDYQTATQKIHSFDYDYIFLDLMLPGRNGLAILNELKTLNKQDEI